MHAPRIVAEPDDGSPGFRGAFARDGERVIAAWEATQLAAAVWDGERPPVALDTELATEAVEDVHIAWGQERGLVVYTHEFLVHARPISVDRPEPPQPMEPTDVSEASDAVADASVDVGSPLPTPELGADVTSPVSRGCCSAVRAETRDSGAAGWWAMLGLLALMGLRRPARQP